MTSPISEKDVAYYKEEIKKNFQKFVSWYSHPQSLFNKGEKVRRSNKTVNKIYDHIYSQAIDNSTDCANDELRVGNCTLENWNEVANKFIAPSVEGIILEIRSS